MYTRPGAAAPGRSSSCGHRLLGFLQFALPEVPEAPTDRLGLSYLQIGIQRVGGERVQAVTVPDAPIDANECRSQNLML